MKNKLVTEFIPASETASRRLMVVLHGLGDSSAGYHWLPAVMGLPWMNYLLVNAPDDYYGGFSWYDFAGEAEPGVRRSIKALTTLLDSSREQGFPTEQTVMFGFSQGCLMTVETGLRYPHRFAGLVGVSGYVFDPQRLLAEMPPAAREQRLFITHGKQDPLIPCAMSRQHFELLRQGGINLDWREYSKAHTIDERQEIGDIREFLIATGR